MSFKYKGVLITMNNYLKVFEGFESDILDEIRSAVLDDTPIGQYIKSCGSDSYKLGQIRLALREYVPKEYLNVKLSGKCINLIRKCFRDGIDLKCILKYITRGVKLENSSLEIILHALMLGANIDKVDFTDVSNNNVEIICEGLIKGYPMWLCVSKEGYLTSSFIRQLMKGMQLGIDIHPFLSGRWVEDQLILILSHAKDVNINDLLCYVNYKFTTDHLAEVLAVAKSRYDFTLLCLQESDGSPSFNPYQMNVLGEALKTDVFCEELYNPKMNDMDMRDILCRLQDKKAKERKPILGGRLRK